MKFILTTLILLAFSTLTFSQQTDRDRAIGLFREGNIDAARAEFEKLVKTDKTDAEAHNYLGLIHLRKKENKKARQQIEKAIALDSKNSGYRVNLAYVLLVSGDPKKARSQADQVLQADPKNITAYYVRGKANLALNKLEDAAADAQKSVTLDRGNPQANILLADILFAKYIGLVRKDYRLKADVENLRLAVETLDNCLKICTRNTETAVVEERRDIIGAFLEAAERKPFIYDPEEPMEMPDPGNRRLKILSKPRASYTDKARMNGISGTVNLMVLFAANGTIPYIIVVKSLDPGLDREAVKAARNIKFEPMTRDGKPASKVVVIQYGFTIY